MSYSVNELVVVAKQNTCLYDVISRYAIFPCGVSSRRKFFLQKPRDLDYLKTNDRTVVSELEY